MNSNVCRPFSFIGSILVWKLLSTFGIPDNFYVGLVKFCELFYTACPTPYEPFLTEIFTVKMGLTAMWKQ